MSGIDGLMAESNERWTEAIRRAQGIQDNGLGEAMKTYYTRYFPVALVLSAAAGTVIGALIFPDAPEGRPTFLAFGIVLGAIVVLISGLIYNAKKVAPAAQVGRIDVLVSLEPDERKRVRRQIAGKAPLDQEHLPVIRAAAVQLRKNLATLLLIQPMIPLVFVPQALNFATRGDSLFGWVMTIGAAVLVIGLGFLARDFRRAGRFLALTRAQADPEIP
ncbi:hypothetical protein [Pseudarthrobacter sp. IC2-21]|uniref:hypothetical protein n=1 Tax=Pseudarthrobacter sp. IC2-21 TaxID=3092262 RepID=UPI002A698D88|nr:hypothetical protein [Pseudarthrobacter sp. IC2-21]